MHFVLNSLVQSADKVLSRNNERQLGGKPMAQTGTQLVSSKFEDYTEAELGSLTTAELLTHYNDIAAELDLPIVSRFATKAKGIERTLKIQDTLFRSAGPLTAPDDVIPVPEGFVEPGPDYVVNGATGVVGGSLAKGHGRTATQSTITHRTELTDGAHVIEISFSIPADGDDIPTAARQALDEILLDQGLIQPKGGRGRAAIKGLNAHLRGLFNEVGIMYTIDELKAATDQYAWADVVRMIAREKSDNKKGIVGPVKLVKAENTYTREA